MSVSQMRVRWGMVLALAAASFASCLGLGMLVPAFPTLTLNEGPLAQSLLVSTFAAARLLVALPSGLAIDRFGLARTGFVALVLLVAGSLVGAVELGYAGLFIAVALQGAGSSIFSTTAMTALVVTMGPDRRPAAMSWFQGALLLAFSFGPVVGGVVVSGLGLRSPFWIQALLCLPIFALLPLLPAAAPRRSGPATEGFVVTPGLVGGSTASFAAFLCRAVVAWVIVPALATNVLHLTTDRLGVIVGVATAVNFIVLPLNARLIGRSGAGPALVMAIVLNVVGLALMAAVTSETTMWIGMIIIMTATGAMLPSAGVIALEGVTPAHTGRTMGTFRMAGDLGMTVGPIGVTWLAHQIGTAQELGFIVILGITAVCLAVILGARLAQIARTADAT